VRYLVVSDVHSNIEALEAAFAELTDDDALLCLGDIVGYGPDPNACVERIRARATATVLGNHDVAAIDDFGLAYFNPAARAAITWTQGVLSAENRAWLDGLGYEYRAPGFLLVHGAPINYFEYILDKAGAARAFAATDAPLIFNGHTHIAAVYSQRADGEIDVQLLQQGGEVALEEGVRYLVNVGSIGQPRDLNPEASFALFDDVARTVTIRRVAYAIAEVQAKIREAHLPATLASRLASGR
jgi:diadenosine tetraphosphatase ApaH/serine/threonine PP2A family protein phosphatase